MQNAENGNEEVDPYAQDGTPSDGEDPEQEQSPDTGDYDFLFNGIPQPTH